MRDYDRIPSIEVLTDSMKDRGIFTIPLIIDEWEIAPWDRTKFEEKVRRIVRRERKFGRIVRLDVLSNNTNVWKWVG